MMPVDLIQRDFTKQSDVTRMMLIVLLTMFTIPLIGQSQWILQNSNAVDNLTDIVMLDSVTAIAAGEHNTILKTTNGGDSWEFIATPWSYSMNWRCISFYNKDNGVLAGGNNILTTTNSGSVWALKYHSEEKNILCAHMLTPSIIFAGDDSGYVHRSLDSGKTWTSSRLAIGAIRSISFTSGAFSNYLGFALTPWSLFVTTNNGVSWNQDNLSFSRSDIPHRVVINKTNDRVYVVGGVGSVNPVPQIYFKLLSDTLWSMCGFVFIPEHPPYILYDAAAPTKETAFSCGTLGMINKTTNGGPSWKLNPATSGVKYTLRGIDFYDDRFGVAVGDSGTILYTSSGGVMHSDNNKPAQPPGKFVLYQNYPNPFNPVTTIRFVLPVLGFTSLNVYDLLGREVVTLKNEVIPAGEHTVQWDASSLPSGMYLCRLQAGEYRLINKLVLMK